MLEYAHPTMTDRDAMVALYAQFLNGSPELERYITEGLQDPEYAGVKCTDTDTGALVGILSARPGVEFTCGHQELVDQIHARWGEKGVYTGDMLVVLPEYRGQGIARELAKGLRRELLAHHAKCVVLEEWIRHDEGDVPAWGTMRHVGERIILTVDRRFYQESEKYGIICPECGVHCHCGAVVSVVEFPQEENPACTK